jgi:hypothetical protein
VLALVRLSEDKPADDVLERLADRVRQVEREGR